MYRRIVVGYDGSDQGRDALALAEALRAPDGVVTWLDVRSVPGASPARALHDLIEQVSPDLVVVAARTAERLLNGSPCPVAVAPAGFATEGGPPRVIGVAYDGSDESKAALDEGARLAARFEAAMKLITVVPPVTAAETVRVQRHEAFRRTLHEAAATLPVEARAAPILGTGRPAAVIADEAEKGIHILVMGSRSYGPLHRVFAGSTAIELMRLAPCPVIVIPRGAAVPRQGVAASAAAAV